MLDRQNPYHAIIRKTIIAFGSLFSNIKITRVNQDSTDSQTIAIPIAYAPKEKWIVRLDSGPELDGQTYITLPRLSFEITGYEYDITRKMNRMNQITCSTDPTSLKTMYAPSPYNISMSLYILTKTQEDALQIIEQILPTFTPEYTLSINAVPEMNVVQDIPVILNSVSVSDEYDGDFQTRRFVTHTLDFTLKVNIFGNILTQGPIKTAIVNVGTVDIDSIDIDAPDLRYIAKSDGTEYWVDADSVMYDVTSTLGEIIINDNLQTDYTFTISNNEDKTLTATVVLPTIGSTWTIIKNYYENDILVAYKAISNAGIVTIALQAQPINGFLINMNNLRLVGSGYADNVYVASGIYADCSLLGTSADNIYLPGAFADYTVSVIGTYLNITREVNGVTEGAMVTANTGAANDRIIFSDGYYQTYPLRLWVNGGATATFYTDMMTPEVLPDLVEITDDFSLSVDLEPNSDYEFTIRRPTYSYQYVTQETDEVKITLTDGNMIKALKIPVTNNMN